MQKLDGQLITVIGGGGFVGRYVVEQALARGARVRIAQRNPHQATFLRPLGGLGQTQFVRADVRDAASIARAVQGSFAVINLAGSFSDMEAIHSDGAAHIADAVRQQGITNLIHLSALGANSDSGSAYGRSKAAGEAAVRSACPHAVILRPSIIFGRDDHFTNMLAAMIRNLPMVPMVHGQTQVQPVYVSDVAEAIITALESKMAGQTLELGGPQIYTMRDLMHWIANATGRRRKFINLPSGLIATLPGAPIHKDQVKMLQDDAVLSAGGSGLSAMGITPTALEAVAGEWLLQYRQSGRFSLKTFA